MQIGVEDPVILGNALVKAYVALDHALRLDQKKSTSQNADKSGCTAVCTLITPKYIICANAGDSRCVLGTRGTTKPLSYDHKPNLELERKRIETAGGCVQWKRVDGDLAVSRAFGDFQYKTRSDLPPEEQKVLFDREQRMPVYILKCGVFRSVAGQTLKFMNEIMTQTIF